MNEMYIYLPAILRILALCVVLWSSVKHRDWLGITICVLWGFALYFATWTTHRDIASLIATPLLYFVAWGIIKRQRGIK